jgi:hypothetical protein
MRRDWEIGLSMVVLISNCVVLLSCQFQPPYKKRDLKTQQRRQAIIKFNAVIEKNNKALELDQKWEGRNTPQPILDRLHNYNEDILRESLTIDIGVLNAIFPDLGTLFRDKMIKFLSIDVETENIGIDIRRRGGQPEMTPDISQKFELSRKLEKEWRDWYNGHYDEIVKASYTADHY